MYLSVSDFEELLRLRNIEKTLLLVSEAVVTYTWVSLLVTFLLQILQLLFPDVSGFLYRVNLKQVLYWFTKNYSIQIKII